MFSRRWSQAYFRAFSVCAIVFLLWLNMPWFARLEKRIVRDESNAVRQSSEYHNLPGANDTLVIMRTGATEIQDKLPIHLTTTLLRYPNYSIFSDHEEEFERHHISMLWKA